MGLKLRLGLRWFSFEFEQCLLGVWVKDGDKLRAIQVEVGISDHRYTELVSGDVKPSDALIIGMQ